jgi:hypothetical protein
MVVFGGIACPSGCDVSNQAWTLSLASTPTWTLLGPVGSPPRPRWAHTAIYDPVRDAMVAFGGFTGTYLNDTWALTWGTPAPNSAIRGTIKDEETGFALAGATVQAFRGGALVRVMQTGGDGRYRFEVPAGTYLLRAQKGSYFQKELADCQAIEGEDAIADITLMHDCWPYLMSSIDFNGFDQRHPDSESARMKLYSPTPVIGTLVPFNEHGWSFPVRAVEASECNVTEISLSHTSSAKQVQQIPFEIGVDGTIFKASHYVVSDYPLLSPADLDRTDWGQYDSLEDLLATFAPVLKFEAGEKYYPVAVDVTLKNASLRNRGPDHPEQSLPDMAGLTPEDLGRYSWSFFTIDLPCDPLQPDGCLSQYWQAGGDPATVRYVVYATAIRQDVGNQSFIALQYWMHYYFNDWETETCIPRLPHFPARRGHEGDWEHVGVVLNMDLEPQQVCFGGHAVWKTYPWNELFIDVEDDTHPIAYVAKGSHANYAGGGESCPNIFKDYHHGNDKVLRRGQIADETHYEIEVLPRWTSPGGDPHFSWLEFSGWWGTSAVYHEAPYMVTGWEAWQGPAFRGEWSNPIGTEFQTLKFAAMLNLSWPVPMGSGAGRETAPVNIHIVDPLGRELGPDIAEIPGAVYSAGVVDTVAGEVISLAYVSIPYPVAGQYNVRALVAGEGRSEGTVTLTASRDWVGSPSDTLVLAQDLPVGEIPPEGFSVIPAIPRVGISETSLEYWNLDWDAGNQETVDWRLNPGRERFDVHELIPESLRLNGTVAPVEPIAFEDSALVLRFPRGAAVHSIVDPQPNTYARVVLTGLFADSLIRLESPVSVRLLTTAGAGEQAAPRDGFRVEFPRGNICRDGVDLRVVLPRAGLVQARIVDVSGRVVNVLVDEMAGEGPHLLHWNGQLSTGKRAPAGVYFVRASFEGKERNPRIIVIR